VTQHLKDIILEQHHEAGRKGVLGAFSQNFWFVFIQDKSRAGGSCFQL